MSSVQARAELTRIEAELRELLDRQQYATGELAARVGERVRHLLERQERLLDGGTSSQESVADDSMRVDRALAARGFSTDSTASTSNERERLDHELAILMQEAERRPDDTELRREVGRKRARIEALTQRAPSTPLLTSQQTVDQWNEPLAVASPDTPDVAQALQRSSRFAESVVRRSRDAIVWARIEPHVRVESRSTSPVVDWARPLNRDALYRALFFGEQPNWRLTPEWWRLVFCDVASERTVLAIGPRSGLRWPMSANGADYRAHRLGFRTRRDDLLFDPPVLHFSEKLEARFSYQTDGNLCAMHALNNLARSFVLTPPTFYQAVFDVANPHLPSESDDLRWFRERANTGGTEGELATAALRRGVLVARVVVRNIYDIESLRAPTAAYPHQAPLEALARRNGGVVALSPNGGHYAAILPTADGRGWVLINDRRPFVVVEQAVRADTFAGLLRAYYLTKLRLPALGEEDLEQVAARMRRQSANDAASEMRLLVPLHFVPQLDGNSPPLDRLAHYWARYVACNTSATTDNVNTPEGDLVLAVNAAYAHVVDTDVRCANEAHNLFSEALAKTAVELGLNDLAEQLAAELLRPRETQRREVLTSLVAQARGALVAPRALGLLLDPTGECSVTSNREWLRLAALHVVVASNAVARASPDLLFLLMNCLFTDHRASGDVEDRYPAIVAIWQRLRRNLVGLSTLRGSNVLPEPGNDLPHERAMRLLLFTLPPDADWNFFQLTVLRRVSFDRSLWLLSAFADAFPGRGVRRETLAYLQPARRLDRLRVEDPASDEFPYVDALRRAFFVSRIEETRDAGARVRQRARQAAALFDQPQFLEWFDVIAAPRLLVVGQAGDAASVSWEERAQIDAVERNKPQLLLRLYSSVSQLYGTFYDRRNERVDPRAAELRDSLTTRFDAQTGALAPSPEPLLRFDDDDE